MDRAVAPRHEVAGRAEAAGPAGRDDPPGAGVPEVAGRAEAAGSAVRGDPAGASAREGVERAEVPGPAGRDAPAGAGVPEVAGSAAVAGSPAVRLRLDLAYDGAAFHGWARQPGLRTVQQTVQDALGRALALPAAPELTVAGRTDAGVHARGQV